MSIFIQPKAGFKGYVSAPKNASASYLSAPSQNCLITSDGKAESRKGYAAEFSIGLDGFPATAFYHETYDVAFFALGTKVFYRDFTAGATYDTGLTLTTGTVTRFTEFFGDVYLTNTTDGPRRIVCMRLNGAVTAGASTITVDVDGVARLQVFSVTSGNLIVNGTAEAFTNPIVPYISVTGTANNGSNLIRITTTAHSFLTGDNVTIVGTGGTIEADGTWTVTRISATQFDLQASTFTNAWTSGGTITWNYTDGRMHLTTTASQAYTDNNFALVVQDISGVTGIQKPSKIELWKSRLHLMGFLSSTNVDQPNNSVIAGQFVIGETGASGIEKIIDFTYGTGGATKIVVGGGGKVTNILGVKDFLYFFTEGKTHAANSADITTSGSAIGLTIPNLKDELHGCVNEDCATIMGNNALTYVTNDKRIMMIPISTETGATVSPPQEDFDVPIREHLKNMAKDQTGAFVFHYRGGRQTIYQLNIAGQWFWFIWDHNIVVNTSSGTQHGAWQPPQSISPVVGLFERKGVLYGTDVSTDTVYSYFTTFTDNFVPIQVIIATGDFNVGNAMMKRAELEGDINQPSMINIKCYVTNNSAGRRSGSAKVIDGNDYTYSDDLSVGAVAIGDSGVEAETTQIAHWKKGFGIFPSQGFSCQLIAENFQDGGYFSVSSYLLTGEDYAGTFTSDL